MIEQESINDKDFEFIRDLVYKNSGIVIADHKKQMVQRRLYKRVRDLDVHSIENYCDILRNNPDGEMVLFINSITTNLTSFFREKHHFDFLSTQFLPYFKKSGQKKLRFWSSACSTGEEPYTLTMVMRETLGEYLNTMDAKILATDLDTSVLQFARKGLYKHSKIEGMDESIKKKWFRYHPEEQAYQIDSSLRELITFNHLNLLGEWPMKGQFDVIFCRNVLIYFDRPTQNLLIEKFIPYLKPGGYVMLGHSESAIKDGLHFQSLGKTIFKKVD